MLFLVVEFGSHGLICSGESGSEGRSVSATEREHEDPCRTLMRCGYDQNNRQAPKFTHDASQHNALFDGLLDLTAEGRLADPQLLLDHEGFALFRPKDPPFHPPKSA